MSAAKNSTPGLSSAALKWVAVVSMLLDHLGYIFLESPRLWELAAAAAEARGEIDPFFGSPLFSFLRGLDFFLRGVGGLAFPIFAFLLVEGFLHTRDLKRYIGRMALFALLSDLPFNAAFFGKWVEPAHQNVFFTLLLGLLGMAALRYLLPKGPLPALGGALGCLLLAELLHTDYGSLGVAVILTFYILRNKKREKLLLAGALMTWYAIASAWLVRVLPVLPAMALLGCYNGERGRAGGKYFFYWFYPLHLPALWGIFTLTLGG